MATVSSPDYFEEREGKFLYFWGDYPHWVITNKTGHQILQSLLKGAPLEEMVTFYGRETGLTQKEAAQDVKHFLKPLIQVGVINEGASAVSNVKEQFSVEDALRNIASIVLNPTRACNYQCEHCYTDAAEPLDHELSLDEMIGIVKQIAPFMRVKILGFLGGEPLLRKEEVLKTAKYWIQKEGGYASVSTNGSLIDSEFAQKAANINLAVQISVDGATPQTCDAVRGEGAWEKAVKGAQILVNHKVATWLCMVYHRDNVSELEDFIQLGVQLGVRGVRFIPYNYLGRGARSDLVKVMPFDMVKRVHHILQVHPGWGDFIDQSFFGNLSVIVRSAPRYVYCGSGLSTLLIESNGDLYPCINLVHPEFKVGNVRVSEFANLWVHSPLLKEIRSLCVEDTNAKCSSCVVRYLCGMGCRAEIYALTHRLTLPTFFCESWQKAVIEMCWIVDEFPNLHERVTAQRLDWPSQSEYLVDEGKVHFLLDKLGCG